TVSAAEPQKVLVLYSTGRDAQTSIIGERDLPRILSEGSTRNLDYYSEYVDQARFPSPDYAEAVKDYLRRKYHDDHFDLIISLQETASRFLVDVRDDVFPDSPVVFADYESVPRIPNSTGISSGLDLSGSVALAAALQPDLRNVFVITGAGMRDKVFER